MSAMFGDDIDPEAYSKLAAEQGVGGSTHAAVRLPTRLPGFVTKRATPLGAPEGWRNAAPIVRVDPGVNGGGFTVDFSKLSSDQRQVIVDSVHTGDFDVSVHEQQERAFKTLERMAAMSSNEDLIAQARPSAPPAEVISQFRQPVAPEPQRLVHQPTQHNGSLFSTTRQPQVSTVSVATQSTSSPAQQQSPAPQPQKQEVERPRYKATFEVKDSPVAVEAWFHAIIRNDNLLVLGYNTECVGYPRMRMHPTENDIAIHIEGSSQLFVAQDLNMRFEHLGFDYQLLRIKETYPLPADHDQETAMA